MKYMLFMPLTVLGILAGIYIFTASQRNYNPQMQNILVNEPDPTITYTPTPSPTPTPGVQVRQPGATAIIPMRTHAFQSFNNCGPASLSMLLSYNDIYVSQYELGMKLRPWQNPQGDHDDKSVTLDELAQESKNYDLIPFHRPTGNLEILKLFIANDIPVSVRTWLYPGEDIGHYRVVRGYDDTTGEIIQDDSYEGKDLRFSYEAFLALWQPFNYEFLVIVPSEKEELVKAILADNIDEEHAWQTALSTAEEEARNKPDDIYPIFNQSIAQFHLGNYEESAQLFESVENGLPFRMLWYQKEPAEVYLKLKQYDRFFQLTERLLVNNLAYSEVYLMRGIAYKEQGNSNLAETEFQKALFYNSGEQIRQKVDSARAI